MSDHEIDAWTALLAHTLTGRMAVIRDLLVHANGDGLTSADRQICRIALVRLEAQATKLRLH